MQGNTEVNYTKSWLWRGGLFLVIFGSVADLAALIFAPQSLVAPLGSFTLVSNIIYAPLLLGEGIDKLSIGATAVIIVGSVVAVIYAPHKDVPYTTSQIFGLFGDVGYILYTMAIISLFVALMYLSRRCEIVESRDGKGSSAYAKVRVYHQFSYPAASGIVGAQSVMFAKCASRVAESAGIICLGLPGWWMVFFMTFACIFTQIKIINDGLKRFDAIYEVPVFQAFWIIFSVLGGMAFYKEYEVMSSISMGLFSFGVIVTLTGVIALSYRKPTFVSSLLLLLPVCFVFLSSSPVDLLLHSLPYHSLYLTHIVCFLCYSLALPPCAATPLSS